MELDDRLGAPTYEALTALDVSAMETERAAHMLAVCTRLLQARLADIHPSTSLTCSEANRLERMAIILAARASLVKALVESQFGSDEGDESLIV
jgi:hypothetical protein